MKAEYEQILSAIRGKEKEILKQMMFLSKFNRNGFDKTVATYHDEVFQNIDCMECGNCCRLIGPRFRDKDIKLVSKEIGTHAKSFAERYLKSDPSDLDFFLLEKLPCPFIGSDNVCSVYENRPLSCVEFPHTNTHNIQKHLVRLGHSAMVCPAAALIVQKILEKY